MMINLFKCKKRCWFKHFCDGTCPWKGSRASWVIIWYVLFWRRGCILQPETVLKDYCVTCRPSVHDCIRHDNVLFFTAINTMAPVGLLLCIVCLDLPVKQPVQETAIFLKQKYCFKSENLHYGVSERSFCLLPCSMQRPGSLKIWC